MGTKRVDGKVKKKSIKAKVTSQFSSKRKLSRMGKRVKKGEMGPNTDFITRSAVLKKLQITLKDFRRLCILKGIYPRVPPKAPKGADKVYYDIKDISYLSHEPLLNKFREFKVFMKKIRKAAGRNQFDEARRKDRLKPVVKLDHLVKERYPRFIDALRDMDDSLCMIHLFAAMPSLGRITAEKTSKCNELIRHWQYYIVKSKTLRKVFVSVKGIYFQAEIMGEPITWLAPHQFAQTVPKEVDLRVMLTFLEFYEVFLKFALFKLYHMQGLRYPPLIDKQLDDVGCYLLAVKSKPLEVDAAGGGEVQPMLLTNGAEGVLKSTDDKNAKLGSSAKGTAKLASLSKMLQSIEDEEEEDEEGDDDDEDEEPIAEPLANAFASIHGTGASDDADEEERRTFATEDDSTQILLFHKLKFFINREVPLDWLQICTLAMGAVVGWEGALSPFDVNDPGITHHVVDRPMQGLQNTSREYVQPQWVFDSINAQMLLPVHRYRPGAKLPPHLSPFVDDDKAGYLPKYREEIRKLKAAAGEGENKAAGMVDDGAGVAPSSSSSRSEREVLEDDDLGEEEDEDAYAAEVRAEKRAGGLPHVDDDDEDGEDDDDSGDDEEDDDDEANTKPLKGSKGVVYKPVEPKLTEDEESAQLARIMMSKKTKRLYGRMQHGISKKQDEVHRLEEKRKLQEDQEAQKSASQSAEVSAPTKSSKKHKSSAPASQDSKGAKNSGKVASKATKARKAAKASD